MKSEKQSWKILEICGSKEHREIGVSLLSKYMLGSQEKENMTKIYFNNKDFSKVEQILKRKKIINNWSWNNIVEKNWNSKCKDFFKPVTIDNRVQIIPSWKKETKDYLTVTINPALAFGTGHHETTYMMIKAILASDIKNKSVIDIGTGSGILSILLHKMGNKNIYAIDNDSLVKSNFYENLMLNNIDDIEFDILDCLSIKEFNYDIVLANINREIIIDLLKLLKYRKSKIILSGILIEDLDMVKSALIKNNKKIVDSFIRNEWSCIVAE